MIENDVIVELRHRYLCNEPSFHLFNDLMEFLITLKHSSEEDFEVGLMYVNQFLNASWPDCYRRYRLSYFTNELILEHPSGLFPLVRHIIWDDLRGAQAFLDVFSHITGIVHQKFVGENFSLFHNKSLSNISHFCFGLSMDYIGLEIFQGCPFRDSLKILDMGSLFERQDPIFLSHVLCLFREVEEVRLDLFPDSRYFFSSLRNMDSLKKLRLGQISRKNLESLMFSPFYGITDLDISLCPVVKKEDLFILLKSSNLPNLRTLSFPLFPYSKSEIDVIQNSNLTEDSKAKILRHPKLKKEHINENWETDYAIFE